MGCVIASRLIQTPQRATDEATITPAESSSTVRRGKPVGHRALPPHKPSSKVASISSASCGEPSRGGSSCGRRRLALSQLNPRGSSTSRTYTDHCEVVSTHGRADHGVDNLQVRPISGREHEGLQKFSRHKTALTLSPGERLNHACRRARVVLSLSVNLGHPIDMIAAHLKPSPALLRSIKDGIAHLL